MSKFVDRVLIKCVQIFTRHGKKAVFILPYEGSEFPTCPFGGLGDFLLSSPLVGSGLEVTRDSSTPRDVGMER